MAEKLANKNHALIAFGANLANPRATLLNAVAALGEAGVVIDRVSPLYRSPAWPEGSGAPDYMNAVMAVWVTRCPGDLMTLLLDIERRLGRVRTKANAPRSIDLDIVDMEGVESADPHIRLPHPRMKTRAFVLLPLRDVAPDWRHPDGESVDALIEKADCTQTVRVS